MAKLRTFRSLDNMVYVIRFENDPAALTNEDKSLMEDFGEPEINLGGTFVYDSSQLPNPDPNPPYVSGGNPQPVIQFTFTLPDQFVKVRSDFPIRVEFDSRDVPWDTYTLTKVNFYEAVIAQRFNDAFVALRAQRPAADAYVGETIYNV